MRLLFCFALAACVHASEGQPEPTRPTNEGTNCVLAKFKEDPKAPELCTRQCDQRDAESCTTLGAMHEQGHLVPSRDKAKAAAAYGRGCDLGDGMGCTALASLTKDSDPKTALSVFERICKWKEEKEKQNRKQIAEACAFTGAAYAEGKLVAKDVKRATDDLFKACKLGSIESCDKLELKPKPF